VNNGSYTDAMTRLEDSALDVIILIARHIACSLVNSCYKTQLIYVIRFTRLYCDGKTDIGL